MELQWPLILFTTLTAWGCGVLGGAGALALKGAGKKSQQLLAILSCVLLAAGGIAVFFHLQHWERIFNGFGHITSGITQELIAIVVFVVIAVAYFVMARKSDDGGTLPKWYGVGRHRHQRDPGRGVRAFLHDAGAPGVGFRVRGALHRGRRLPARPGHLRGGARRQGRGDRRVRPARRGRIGHRRGVHRRLRGCSSS